MATGTVKFFNASKGFGFIVADEDGKDIFVPASSVALAGVSRLQTGQRVSFNAEQDKKGPKAIDLRVIDEVQSLKIEKSVTAPRTKDIGQQSLTIYMDPASNSSNEILAELRDAGQDPRVVNYFATPLSREQLRTLSLLLRNNNQSLVKKYDPLFLELRLDDRFISDSEFWEAIMEHPLLINGPVVATETHAGICSSKGAVKSFLATISSGARQTSSKQKVLPERLLRLLAGNVAAPPPANENEIGHPEKENVDRMQEKPESLPVKKARARAETGTKTKAKASVKTNAPAKVKGAAKVKRPAKKVTRKSAQKSRRG